MKLSACRGKLWNGKPDAPLGPLQVLIVMTGRGVACCKSIHCKSAHAIQPSRVHGHAQALCRQQECLRSGLPTSML